MTRPTGGLEVGWVESEVGASVKGEDMVDFGWGGKVADLTYRVEDEVSESGEFPRTGVVEGFVGMVGRGMGW